MYRLYDYLPSGNSYKARLALTQLGCEWERIDTDIIAQATRTPQFLERNPNGRIPTLELPDGSYLWESGAILWYLAEGTDLLPADRLQRSRILQWMFFEQYSHEPFIAVARFIHMHTAPDHPRRATLGEKMTGGYAALGVMESHLARRRFFVGDTYTIADIALYAYTHVADEGGFELTDYPLVRAWLARVADQPRHIPITAT